MIGKPVDLRSESKMMINNKFLIINQLFGFTEFL